MINHSDTTMKIEYGEEGGKGKNNIFFHISLMLA
jgi:hypothetical protein